MYFKPQSHRIVRLLDRTIDCDLANVGPISNVCYDLQKRSRAIVEFCDRSYINRGTRRSIVRSFVALGDRSYDQSWDSATDRTINCLPLTIWNSRFQVLNMTVDFVATNLPLAITHDLCDQSYDLCDRWYVLSTICPRLQHFSIAGRSSPGRKLGVTEA